MALTVSALTTFAKEFERINDQINAQMAEKVLTMTEKWDKNSERFEELKEQLSSAAVSEWIKNATETQRGQFRHIAKFTHPVASTKALLTKGSDYLRNKKKNKSA